LITIREPHVPQHSTPRRASGCWDLAVKSRYVGRWPGCGPIPAPERQGRRLRVYCKACRPGAVQPRWTRAAGDRRDARVGRHIRAAVIGLRLVGDEGATARLRHVRPASTRFAWGESGPSHPYSPSSDGLQGFSARSLASRTLAVWPNFTRNEVAPGSSPLGPSPDAYPRAWPQKSGQRPAWPPDDSGRALAALAAASVGEDV
jgi:hypothetical protein